MYSIFVAMFVFVKRSRVPWQGFCELSWYRSILLNAIFKL